MRFGEKLAEIRKSHGYTQENLAEKLGVSRQAIARWEANDTVPDITMLLGICEIFHVSADYMIHSDYKSDQDIPAVKEKSCEVREITEKSSENHLIAGICLAIAALCSIIGFGILMTSRETMLPIGRLALTELSIGIMMFASVSQFVFYFKKR